MEERSNEQILFESIFGVPESVAKENGVEKFTSAQLDSVLDALGDAKQKEEKFMKDNFSYLVEYIEENKKELEEILDFYFKDRWELQVDPGGSSQNIEHLKSVVNSMEIPEDKLKNRKQFFEFLVRHRNYNSIHNTKKSTLLVYFPELNITNTARRKHKIVDLWMKFHFNFMYRMTSMGGTRSSKSYQEYQAGYNHSHMHTSRDCSRDTLLSCCLGETHYRTLQTQLFAGFDKTDMTLFMQQLEDYLSWESLQGGPHIRMESIGNRNYNTYNRSYLSVNVLNQTYQDFLRKYPNGYNIQLEDNGFYFKFKVVKDEEFKEKVTQVCPEQYKMLYDIVQKKQYVEDNDSVSSREIEGLNVNYRRNPLFTFKGNPVYFQIIDPNIGKEKKDNANIVKVAPDQLINHVATSLEQGINKYYVKKFQQEFLSKK